VDRGIDGGQPLRIRFGEHVNMLAGGVMFLEPGAAYKLELCAQDPDGNVALRTVTISTRPRPSSGARLPTLHVAPGTDVRDHQQFAARRAETGRDAERVAQFLRQHHEDRPQANERYRSAADLLERVRRDSAGRGADWKQLLRQVEEAAGLLKQAEELARQDLQLAERAAAEIDAAERELLRARNFFQLGISADLTKAEALLAQARRELANQAYEQAISQAGSAQQAARQAHAEAAQRAQQEQQRLEQERQRAEAAAAAQYAVPPGQTTTPGTPEWLNTTGADMNPPTAGPRQIEV